MANVELEFRPRCQDDVFHESATTRMAPSGSDADLASIMVELSTDTGAADLQTDFTNAISEILRLDGDSMEMITTAVAAAVATADFNLSVVPIDVIDPDQIYRDIEIDQKIAKQESLDLEDEERPLKKSRKKFQRCLSDDGDIDMTHLLDAILENTKMLLMMGKFANPLVQEVKNNLKKISSTYQKDPTRYRSMRSLLKAEEDAKIHKKGAVLNDSSSAMGLLWARRGLHFWVSLLEQMIQTEREPKLDLKQAGVKAFEIALKPHAGRVTTTVFHASVLKSFPKWNEVQSNLGPALYLSDDVRAWTDAVRQVLDRMEAIQSAANMEDRRKSI